MELTVNDHYVDSTPSPQNAVQLFEGRWTSAVPIEGISTGKIALFDDSRVKWLAERRGSLQGVDILELGPLEGGHTYMMERAGARSVTAIEANSLAYLRCLVVKELLSLKASRFMLGDFGKFLAERSRRFDIIFASGVLYHLNDPLSTLQDMMWASDEIFIWSHFFSEEAMPPSDPRRLAFTGEVGRRELAGDTMTYHVRSYEDLPSLKFFCGGINSGSVWLDKKETMQLFEHHGFSVEVSFEHDDHPNGPAACIYAYRNLGGRSTATGEMKP